MTRKMNQQSMSCSRRNFLALGAASALSAASSQALAVDKIDDVKWDESADVVVLGYGNAGTNAAIAAHDAGASVVILEKMAEGGGNVAECLVFGRISARSALSRSGE